jgi:hypothetical protein
MAVAFENYLYSNPTEKGKPYFVPTDRCRRIGAETMTLVRARVKFEHHYYHFSKGAHVAALHAHRAHRYFARLDIQNFFYSVGRNRVKSALKDIGVPYAEHFAKWSTVRNPYDDPRYALPYGFVQSPLLASLVLRQSAIGTAIRDLPVRIKRSVYLDDIALSANKRDDLEEAFETVIAAVEAANFTLNEAKVIGPSTDITLFNCDLSSGMTKVSDPRIAKFYDAPASEESVAGFEAYLASVEAGNR